MQNEDFERLMEDLKKRRIPREVKTVVRTMIEKKARKVVVLKLKGISEVTDFMVICNGNSTRQNQAIANSVKRALKTECKQKVIHSEGEKLAEWILIDYIDIIVHVFTEENRRKFALEKLWMDAKRYDFNID